MVDISNRFRPALELLLRAFDYSREIEVDRWQFALSLEELLAEGASVVDIRWLILRRFARHARETTVPGDPQRLFRPLATTSLPGYLCLVLTPDGARVIRQLLSLPTRQGGPGGSALPTTGASTRSGTDNAPGGEPGWGSELLIRPAPGEARGAWRVEPVWDASHRELRYNGRVVKRYRVPAPNQIAVLDAFQEEGWPEFIDDPIPPVDDHNSKRRLSVTIKTLNQRQIAPLLRFHGNGDGQQVHWEPVGTSGTRFNPADRTGGRARCG